MSPARLTDSEEPLIPAFYAGRSVFITGATGFMGKVLIERLLSTCPDICRLYLLMRTKKDVAPEERLQVLKDSKVFDVLREKNPSQLDKLVFIPGDVSEPQLGITTEYLGLLHDVSIVFHSAATLKFDEELKKAVEQNVRSVMRVMDICDRLPHMEAFIHVSTAYSNCELSYVEERVYPPPAPLDQLLALVDSAPPKLLTEITNKYIAPKPNTYTFTKAIAENVIEQHGQRNYSIAIFRPSIVVSSLRNPFPGWIENLNGPSGIAVAAGKGFLHVFSCKTSARADLLPVDIAIDTLIAVGWETVMEKSRDIRVYHCSTYDNPTTWKNFELALRKYIELYPFDNMIWYPYGFATENEFVVKSMRLLTQTIPMYIAEYLTNLFGVKKQISFITAGQKVEAMSKVLKFFSMKEFRFETTNMRRLKARLSPADAKIYNLDVESINWEDLTRDFVMGTRKYLLREKDQDLDQAKQRLRKLWYLHQSVCLISMLLFLRLLLRNQLIKNFVYGAIRLMISFVYTAYSSAVEKVK